MPRTTRQRRVSACVAKPRFGARGSASVFAPNAKVHRPGARQYRSASVRAGVVPAVDRIRSAPLPSIIITHTTTYRYRGTVKLGPHRLMLRPRETRDLALTTFDLEIVPAARIDWSHDVAGNAVASASFDVTADTLSVGRNRAAAFRNQSTWTFTGAGLQGSASGTPQPQARLGAPLIEHR